MHGVESPILIWWLEKPKKTKTFANAHLKYVEFCFLVLLLTVPGMEEGTSETDKNLSKQGWDAKKVTHPVLVRFCCKRNGYAVVTSRRSWECT